MGHSVRLADLQALTPSERENALARLADEAQAPPNGLAIAATARVREFERRYEMTSAELVDRLRSGEQPETDEIAEWLFWLQVKERVGAG